MTQEQRIERLEKVVRDLLDILVWDNTTSSPNEFHEHELFDECEHRKLTELEDVMREDNDE